jgi:hypothetical protein
MEPARKFRIIVNSKECGTCSGPSPSAVAKKVIKKLCGKSNKTVKFSLKECKRGCERVCGPYQGRMEKLDRPCKRGGKTITHWVVCGKVRKMKGGRDLVASDFERSEIQQLFHETMIDGKPHLFFGGYYRDPFKYAIFNKEILTIFGKKSIGISVLEKNDTVNPIPDLKNLSLELEYELSRLRENLKIKTEYKTIKDFLKKYNIFEFIKKKRHFPNANMNNVIHSKNYDNSYNPHTVLEQYDGKYSVLFFNFRGNEPLYCLVFTDNEFIVIYLGNSDGDIRSIELIFGDIIEFNSIYLLANDPNVPAFIKIKLQELIDKETEIRKKIREFFKELNLKNIRSQQFDFIEELKINFRDIPENIFHRIIAHEVNFIEKQVKKSKNAHMNRSSKKNIKNVYGINIDETEENNYSRFFNEGKRLANENLERTFRNNEERTARIRKKEEKENIKRRLMNLNQNGSIRQEIAHKLRVINQKNNADLNKLVKNISRKNMSNEEFELLKQYAQQIRNIKKIARKYLNDHPETKLHISRYYGSPSDLHKNHKNRILTELKKEHNLSNYENDLIVESIIRRSNTKDSELKRTVIKPFAASYAKEHPDLTKEAINGLSNNNINHLLHEALPTVPEALYYNKENIRHQLEKAIRK